MTQKDWLDILTNTGLVGGILILALLFIRYGLPKIVSSIDSVFTRTFTEMQRQQNESQSSFQQQLEDTRKGFLDYIEKQDRRHAEQEERLAVQLKEEAERNRELQREAAALARDNAVMMSELRMSVDGLKTEMRELTGQIKRATGRYEPAEMRTVDNGRG